VPSLTLHDLNETATPGPGDVVFDRLAADLTPDLVLTAPTVPSIDATLAERGSRYGKFTGHARVTQAVKGAMYDSPNWTTGRLDEDMKEALEMIAHKVGRILNGDPMYADSWTDIAGYARLVEARLLTGEQK
jgi:hypothetical protein